MYITLPSNSSTELYPQNTVSDFKVHLPKEINLIDQWEVGLSEVFYTNSWYNVETNLYWVYFRRGEVSVLVWITAGFYRHPEFIVREMLHQMRTQFKKKNREMLEQNEITEPVDFLFNLRYNTYSQLCEIIIDHKEGGPMIETEDGTEEPNVTLTLSRPLAEMLGFEKTQFLQTGVFRSDHTVNLDTVNALYLYCDVMEHRTVGHTLAPLLGVIPVEGRPGSHVSKRYEKLQYHPVIKKNISDIHITIRDDQGRQIRFRKGKLIVTLHFRRRKLTWL